jgi:hypothetical protein
MWRCFTHTCIVLHLQITINLSILNTTKTEKSGICILYFHFMYDTDNYVHLLLTQILTSHKV